VVGVKTRKMLGLRVAAGPLARRAGAASLRSVVPISRGPVRSVGVTAVAEAVGRLPVALAAGMRSCGVPTGAAAATAAAAAVAAAAAAAALCDAPGIKEPATGMEFDGSIEGAELRGLGCRYKFGLVKIYAVGIYSSVPSPFTNAGSDEAVCRAVLDSTQPKAVVLKMARGLDSKSLVGALEDAFKPRLSKDGRSMAGWSVFRDSILQQTGSRCEPEDEFYFCCEGDRLSVTLKRKGDLHVSEAVVDKDICWALFDTYLGVEEPEVSPSLKKAVIQHYRQTV